MGKNSFLEKFKEREGVYDVPVRDFDIADMSQDQHDQMLGDVYGGYKTKKVPRYETRGAGRNGMAEVQTGYDDEINYDYYKDNKAWQQVADEVGITGAINNPQELGVMAHYITQYGQGGEDDQVAPMLEDEVASFDKPGIALSRRAAEANANTKAYEDVLLNKQGTVTIGGDSGPEQQYKDAYQNNLTEELKVKDPTTLATSKAKYELADRQGADVADSFELGLGSSPSNKNLKFS